MITVLIKSFLTFFAIYGLVQLIKDIIDFFALSSDHANETVIVIKVKNSEETLEGVVRSVIWKCLKSSFWGKIPDILIVDLGSDDSTAQIAQKLCEDYSFIYYTTEDLYNKAKGYDDEI
ncbi:MAG: glycosyltransferase [Clostridia bacterium]|nr:glycosyltransferase [Clostridia bacterium]